MWLLWLFYSLLGRSGGITVGVRSLPGGCSDDMGARPKQPPKALRAPYECDRCGTVQVGTKGELEGDGWAWSADGRLLLCGDCIPVESK